MADNNKIIIEITTNDKGTTAAIKNNKKLKDTIDKTNKSTKDATKTGGNYHSQQKSLYQTNLSSAIALLGCRPRPPIYFSSRGFTL